MCPWQVQRRRRQVVGDEAADEAQPQPLFCFTVAIVIATRRNKHHQLTFYRSEYRQKWTFHCNFSGSRVKQTWMFLTGPLLYLISQNQRRNIASGFRLVKTKEGIKLLGYIITRKARPNRDWTGSNHSNVNAGINPETNFREWPFQPLISTVNPGIKVQLRLTLIYGVLRFYPKQCMNYQNSDHCSVLGVFSFLWGEDKHYYYY